METDCGGKHWQGNTWEIKTNWKSKEPNGDNHSVFCIIYI